jgi:tetratricopeptide (TPR) repeat protein
MGTMRYVRRLAAIGLLSGVFGFPTFAVLSAANAGFLDPARPEAFSAAASLEEMAARPDGSLSLEAALRAASSAGAVLTGIPSDEARMEKDLGRLTGRVRRAVGDRREPRQVMAAMSRVIFEEEGFAYDPGAEPESYLLDRVLARKRGNCLGLSALYLVLAERLDLPVRGVHVPAHCFVRYEAPEGRLNAEMADRGGAWEDGRYARLFRIAEGRPYMRSLSTREMIGVYLLNVGASHLRGNRDAEALRSYRLAILFHPDLPEAYFNTGALFQRRGRADEAVAEYRRALSLDPGLAVARNNLGAVLAGKGLLTEALEEARKAVALDPRSAVARGNLALALLSCGRIDEGIDEWMEVLALDPGSPRALEGLAKAYFHSGRLREAAPYYDRATRLGVGFDPRMVEALDPLRPKAASDPL